MWVFDRRSRAILAANDAVVRALGYTREHLLTCSVGEICLARRSDGGPCSPPRPETEPQTGVFRLRRKDGSLFDADVITIDVDDNEYAATMVLAQPIPGRNGS
jgi:PAS domain-containing protein